MAPKGGIGKKHLPPSPPKEPAGKRKAFKAPTKVKSDLSQNNKEKPKKVKSDLSQNNKENQAPIKTTAKKRPISPIRAPPAEKTSVERHELAAIGDSRY